ncbi:MAG TPA: hypothetical protein P5311_00850, partial [Candidatus Dojkabacteria bacterium]|nr:hypothetical protein [Candidatus Dojkabacteria bacterium]
MRKCLYLSFILSFGFLGFFTSNPLSAADDLVIDDEAVEEIVEPEGKDIVLDENTKLSENRYFDLTLE